MFCWEQAHLIFSKGKSRMSGSVKGRNQLVDVGNIVSPPGNQATNGENKPQPVASGETGLLDSPHPLYP